MEENKVKTILISQNDRFYFSRKYDETKLKPLAIGIRSLHGFIRELPVLPALNSQLDEEIMRRSIHGTAAIEGNPLSEEEVGKILSESNKVERTRKAEIEIENLKIAYGAIDKYENRGSQYLSEEFVSTIHSIIKEGLTDTERDNKGYRLNPVKVGDKEHGGTYHPPNKHDDIVLLMREFISWINSEEVLQEDLLVRAALAHYYIALIHPFTDGNGRTSRLTEAFLLQATGFKYAPKMLSNYYNEHTDEYYWAFSLSEKNRERDITPFIEFYFKALNSSLEDLKKRVLGGIRYLVLRDYYQFLRKSPKKINQRQFDLLRILLVNHDSITLLDLFQSPKYSIIFRGNSERTARRDLNALLKQNLLIQSEEGKYELNTKVLDTL